MTLEIFRLIIKNPLFKSSEIWEDKGIQKKIEVLIQKVTTVEGLRTLVNIHEFLSENVKRKISDLLKTTELSYNFVRHNLNALTYFSNGNKEIQDKLKEILLCGTVFETGISIRPDGISRGSGGAFPIQLHQTRKTVQYPIGLQWNDNEILKICSYLKDSLIIIEKWENNVTNNFMNEFLDINLLEEM